MRSSKPKTTAGRCNVGDKVKLHGSGDTREFIVGESKEIEITGYINLLHRDKVGLIVAKSCPVTLIKAAKVSPPAFDYLT